MGVRTVCLVASTWLRMTVAEGWRNWGVDGVLRCFGVAQHDSWESIVGLRWLADW
jgi:hypothetical protein